VAIAMVVLEGAVVGRSIRPPYMLVLVRVVVGVYVFMLMPVLMCLCVDVAVTVMQVLMLMRVRVPVCVRQPVRVCVSVRVHLLKCSREHWGVRLLGVVVVLVGFVYVRRQCRLTVRLVVLILMVRMSVGVRVIRLPALAHELYEPALEERRTDGDHHQPRGDTQPRVQLLGQDEARGEQGQ
jgi:hypothetical protein